MTEKILILDRKNHSLEIQDEDYAYSYSYIGALRTLEKIKQDMAPKTEFLIFLSATVKWVSLRMSKK